MITLDFSWNICKPIKQFNKTIKNTLTNLISHQTIICVDKNLPWINNKVKSLAREKNKSLMIEQSKQSFYSRITKKSLVNFESRKLIF